MKYELMYIIPTILYTGAIFILSVINIPWVIKPFRGTDKVIHFVLYAIMAFLWVRIFISGARSRIQVKPGRMFFKAIAITFFCGLLIEFVQGIIPSRDASFLDAMANGAGGGAGAFLSYLLHRYIGVKEAGRILQPKT